MTLDSSLKPAHRPGNAVVRATAPPRPARAAASAAAIDALLAGSAPCVVADRAAAADLPGTPGLARPSPGLPGLPRHGRRPRPPLETSPARRRRPAGRPRRARDPRRRAGPTSPDRGLDHHRATDITVRRRRRHHRRRRPCRPVRHHPVDARVRPRRSRRLPPHRHGRRRQRPCHDRRGQPADRHRGRSRRTTASGQGGASATPPATAVRDRDAQRPAQHGPGPGRLGPSTTTAPSPRPRRSRTANRRPSTSAGTPASPAATAAVTGDRSDRTHRTRRRAGSRPRPVADQVVPRGRSGCLHAGNGAAPGDPQAPARGPRRGAGVAHRSRTATSQVRLAGRRPTPGARWPRARPSCAGCSSSSARSDVRIVVRDLSGRQLHPCHRPALEAAPTRHDQPASRSAPGRDGLTGPGRRARAPDREQTGTHGRVEAAPPGTASPTATLRLRPDPAVSPRTAPSGLDLTM